MHAVIPICIFSATTYLLLNKTWETSKSVKQKSVVTLPDPELFISLNDVPAKIVVQTVVDVMPFSS